MPFTTEEAVAAAFKELPIVQDIVAKVNALPPAESRKATDYAPIFGFQKNGAVYLILAEVDGPTRKAYDLVAILGADPLGNFAGQASLIDQVIADIKD